MRISSRKNMTKELRELTAEGRKLILGQKIDEQRSQAMKIMANNTSINYEIAGNGKWLTLIHGAGDNLGAWWNQVPALSQNHRVLTYDVRGHGQTETPPGEYTIGILVQDLYDLIEGPKHPGNLFTRLFYGRQDCPGAGPGAPRDGEGTYLG